MDARLPSTPIRIGVLGAARIVKQALLDPARGLAGVQVAAIAARDGERARRYAQRHQIERAHASYESLLNDSSIDAVYIPLPAALHEEWATAAIEAGKHVLVEKPFTSNAVAAERLSLRAAQSDSVVMEAYHSAHHPLQHRLRDILSSGMLGTVMTASATFCTMIPPGRDIRWNLALGGGGLLDVGYYPLRQLRDLFGEVLQVESAQAFERDGIDRMLTASLLFGSNIRGSIVSSIWSRRLLQMSLKVKGTEGTLKVSLPYHPHHGAVIRVDSVGARIRERADRRSTYSFQLQQFRDSIRGAKPALTDAAAGAAQMRSIDQIYSAAGMNTRP